MPGAARYGYHIGTLIRAKLTVDFVQKTKYSTVVWTNRVPRPSVVSMIYNLQSVLPSKALNLNPSAVAADDRERWPALKTA